jgi:hypothetical protein
MNITFKSGLSDAQKLSVQQLAEKPLFLWSKQDKENWNYATVGTPIPGSLIYFKQGDPRWAKNRIGVSWITLGSFGCVATCLAMICTYIGQPYTPAQVAAQKSWFLGGLIWWSRIFVPRLKFVRREYGCFKSNIKACILDNPNTFVMLQIKNKKIKEHWLWAIGVNGNSFWVADPLVGDKVDLISRYGNSITGAAYFEKT